MDKIDLHIVSFNVPFPADYGGVIDVYYKLKALSDLGIRVAFHCFDYGRGEKPNLEEVAAEVYYYPRDVNKLLAVFSSPFTVKSRASKELLERLTADSAPILFESLQCCLYLGHPRLADKNKWVRAHNVEHDYYRSLANYESAGVRKLYYLKEAKALEKFESVLEHADGVFAISTKDMDYFKGIGLTAHYLPAFSNVDVTPPTVIKEFALYHGNLEVEENIAAIDFLVDIFELLPYKLVVAGRNPSFPLKKRLKTYHTNIDLVENPSEETMQSLINSAKVHCLPTFQSTGIKLKLINSLRTGNQVLVNPDMVEGTGLTEFCVVEETEVEWIKRLEQLFATELDVSEVETRKHRVSELFNNQQNAKRLVEWLGLAQ